MNNETHRASYGRRFIDFLGGRGSDMTTRRSTLLLVTLLLMYAYVPLDVEFRFLKMDYFFVIIVLAMVFTVSTGQRRSLLALALGILFLVFVVLVQFIPADSEQLNVGYLAVLGLFVGYSAIVILYEVTQTRKFNYHLIVSALSAYLLIALLWAVIYTIIELSNPGSFSIKAELAAAMPREASSIFDLAFYYSLITLTTVGYGDITPISAGARSLATLEPVMGQILLTVLVAWLVGMHVSTSLEFREEERSRREESE